MRTPLARAPKITTLLTVTSLLLVHRTHEIHAQSPALSWDGFLEHVTAPHFDGSGAPDGSSRLSRHSVSGDGRYVLFASDAENLGGAGYAPLVLLRDRHTGQIQQVLPYVDDLALSADGNHVAFRRCDPAWRPDFTPICDVWAFDQRTNMLTPLSVALDGTFGDADSSQPVLSATGRFVVFRTNASNLLPPGAAPGQIVVVDRDADGNGVFDEPGTKVVELVSGANGSGVAGNDVSEGAEVSDDGRYVAFRSKARNLDGSAGYLPDTWHVFEHDRLTHETRLLDRRPTGQPSPLPVDRPEISMSADGRYVAFASPDRLLAGGYPDDMDDAEDVFVYDHDTWVLSRIDLSDGVASAMDVDQPMLSADGRYVAMRAWSQNSAAPWGGLARAIFVYDRITGTSTKVSVRPDGSDLDWHADSPVISADGTVVLFTSRASNAAPGLDYQFDKIFAAVHFDVQPSEIVVPGHGGPGTFTVTTQQHTRWAAQWDWTQYWFTVETPPFGNVGSGQITFNAMQGNPDPVRRSVAITIGPRPVTFTEDVGLSLTSVSPSAGPQAGGTVVTLRGTGFEPGMYVLMMGGAAPAEFVNDTTIRVTTLPASQPGLSWVFVVAPDGRMAGTPDAFRYLDGTPPQVFFGVNGTLGQNGWYTSDVTVYWGWWDGESQVTSTVGCDPVVINTDTPGTTLTCSATSEGGTGSASVTIKRDATPPTIVITQPARTIYTFGEAVPAIYTCSDALSGSDWCAGSVMPGEPFDTSYAGFDQ